MSPSYFSRRSPITPDRSSRKAALSSVVFCLWSCLTSTKKSPLGLLENTSQFWARFATTVFDSNGTKITANPLYIRLLGVGCRVLGVCSESEIYLYPHSYKIFLIFAEPATLPPTPSPDELLAFLSAIRI